MKKIISALSAVLILISSFMFLTASAENVNDDTVLNWRDDFLWGQNMNNNRRGCDSPDKYSEEALHYAAQQGVKLIRYQGQYLQDDFTETDTIIGLCNKYGIKVMLCIWPSWGVTTDEPTKEDLDFMTMSAKAFAERYNGKNGRGKVDYFQLWNEEEIGLMRAKYGASAVAGDLTSHYYTVSVEGKDDLVEFAKCYAAAAKGIREADTDAKIIINFSSAAFGCVKYYYEQGVDFDYIGWDFYTIGDDVQSNVDKFLGILRDGWYDERGGYHDSLMSQIPDKEVIICESNIGMLYQQDKLPDVDYSPFLSVMKEAYKVDAVKAFCTFKLLDAPSHVDPNETDYGHIKVEKGGKIIEPKQLYYDYQHLIGGGAPVKKLLKESIDLEPYRALKVVTQDDSDLKQDETPNLNDTDLDDNLVDDELQAPVDDIIIETVPQEPIVETVTITPDDIYNKTTSTITKNIMPWGLIIIVGVGMLVVAAAVVVAYLYFGKKKAKIK